VIVPGFRRKPLLRKPQRVLYNASLADVFRLPKKKFQGVELNIKNFEEMMRYYSLDCSLFDL
jgi:hypothetical protein